MWAIMPFPSRYYENKMRLNTYGVPSQVAGALKYSTRSLSPIPSLTPSLFSTLGMRIMSYAKAGFISILSCSSKTEAVLKGGTSMNFSCR